MILLRRGLKERRHTSFVVLNIAQVTVITLFCDLLWWRLDTNHIQDQRYSHSLRTRDACERKIFRIVPSFPCFMSRTIGDRPMELVLPKLFCILTYGMAGLKTDVGSFLYALIHNSLKCIGLTGTRTFSCYTRHGP